VTAKIDQPLEKMQAFKFLEGIFIFFSCAVFLSIGQGIAIVFS
jgi:hypothetical protein